MEAGEEIHGVYEVYASVANNPSALICRWRFVTIRYYD